MHHCYKSVCEYSHVDYVNNVTVMWNWRVAETEGFVIQMSKDLFDSVSHPRVAKADGLIKSTSDDEVVAKDD